MSDKKQGRSASDSVNGSDGSLKSAQKFYTNVQTLSSDTNTKISDATVKSFNSMYGILEKSHVKYLTGVYNREIANIDKINAYRTGKKYTAPTATGTGETQVPQVKKDKDAIALANKEYLREINKIKEDVAKESMSFRNQRLAPEKETFYGITKSIEDAIDAGTMTGSQGSKEFEVAFKTFNKASTKADDAANNFNIATNAFSSFVKIWTGRMETGINNIYSAYESTYTRVSVLMQENQKGNREFQSDTAKALFASNCEYGYIWKSSRTESTCRYYI